jgi:hypothetical protein
MSRSPFFFVERFDRNTGKYEMQHPIVWNYNHTKQEPADLFPYNGCHDLFSIVENNDTGNDFPTMRGIHCGLPKNVATEIKEAYDSHCYEIEYEGGKHLYAPAARWFTYADMYIYCLEHPKVVDYEAYYNEEEENPPKKIMKPTPVKSLMDRVDAFLEVMDGWDWRDDYSQIRIVYWIE